MIAEFDNLSEKYQLVAGFEANGGFLLGSDASVYGKEIKALPTRDAVLPALMLLAAAKEKPIYELVNALPQRYTYSDRIQNFETEKSSSILSQAKEDSQQFINKLGFNNSIVESVNLTDGFRVSLINGDIIHLRSSGNAPELRCYVESTSMDNACYLVRVILEKFSFFNEL